MTRLARYFITILATFLCIPLLGLGLGLTHMSSFWVLGILLMNLFFLATKFMCPLAFADVWVHAPNDVLGWEVTAVFYIVLAFALAAVLTKTRNL